MANNADLEKALTTLKANALKVLKSERYYKGNHDLAFATEKFKNAFGSLFREFALNLCPAVCDAVKDKLIVSGFRVEAGGAALSDEAWKIWQNNRMGKRSGEVHKEAVKNGDAYVIVWTDPNGNVTIYPHKAKNCMVVYDEETPGKILWAAKTWQTNDKKTRINLFYPDRIERYISKEKIDGGLPDAGSMQQFIPDGESDFAIPNEFGVVPVFHFANNADLGAPGQSELDPAIPVQDGLNKSVLDMLVAMEFASYRQRWASGIEIEYDDDGKPIPPFTAGIERLWIAENSEAKFGDFEAANLEQFLKVKADFRVDLACVTGTPLYYFMLTEGTPPSGESLKKSETRFVNKVNDRMESFGQVWEDAMSFAVRLAGNGENVRFFTEWNDPAPSSESEKLGNLVLKKEIGVTDSQLQSEAGYGAADIARMKEEKQKSTDDLMNAFNAGE